jgi:hypothetical protein
MGQYHIVVNLDKKQYLKPHDFECGAKLMEFGSGGDVMLGLALLLAFDNGRGGGDARVTSNLIGSWAGDRIVIAGDYGDEDPLHTGDTRNLYQMAYDDFENLSSRVFALVQEASK